jgi:hypothetical protein
VEEAQPGLMQQAQRFFLLTQIDNLWKEHLQAMQFLRQAVGLRGCAFQPLFCAYPEWFQPQDYRISIIVASFTNDLIPHAPLVLALQQYSLVMYPAEWFRCDQLAKLQGSISAYPLVSHKSCLQDFDSSIAVMVGCVFAALFR